MQIAPQFGKSANPTTTATSWDLSKILTGVHWADNYYGPDIETAKNALKTFKDGSGSNPGFLHPKRLKLWWLTQKQFVAKELLNYDFVDFHNYKMGPFKVLFSTPPRGALVAFAYIGLEIARAKRAWERSWVKDDTGKKIKQDFRELRDIAIRDTWSIAVYIWGLPIFNKLFLNAGSKASGINLNEKGASTEYTYAQHQANRSLGHVVDASEKLLATAKDRYLANLLEGSHWGMHKAAQSNTFLGIPRKVFQAVKELGETALKQLDRYADMRRDYVSGIEHDAWLREEFMSNPAHRALAPEAKFKAFAQFVESKGDVKGSAILEALQKEQDAIIRLAPKETGAKIAKLWQRSDNYLARAAKSWAAAMGAASFGVVLLLIGWLPVAYNAWYTEREFKRMKEEQAKISPLLQLSKRATLFHGQPYAQ